MGYDDSYLDELASEVYLHATSNVPKWSGGREDKGLDIPVRGGSGSRALSWSYGSVGKQRMLAEGTKAKMDMVVQVTESMRREYLYCQQVRDLNLLLSRAKEAATAVEDRLKVLLLKRVFPGKCRFCPDA